MLSALTILTIFGSVASLLGFAFLFFGKMTVRYKWICGISFGLATIWSAYVLLMPGSKTEINVASNIEYYRFPNIEKKSETLLIQRGKFSLFSFNPVSVEFLLPFRDSPEVEVVNFEGYDSSMVPHIQKVTPHQFEICLSQTVPGLPPASVQGREFRWIARGIPLAGPLSTK
jgi:hypothetical protein